MHGEPWWAPDVGGICLRSMRLHGPLQARRSQTRERACRAASRSLTARRASQLRWRMLEGRLEVGFVGEPRVAFELSVRRGVEMQGLLEEAVLSG